MLNLVMNVVMLLLSFISVYIFARKGASNYLLAKEQLTQELEFYTELVLGMESAGQHLSRSGLLKREIRIAIWELYNNLRVQPQKQNKSIVLHRKMLDKKQTLYRYLEEGKVNLEVLPFIGILGTLLGFTIPYLMNSFSGTKYVFHVTGAGFFLATSSTICAVIALTYLKKKYESSVLAMFDYYECQQKAVQEIMVENDGFRIFDDWLRTWSEDVVFHQPEQSTQNSDK